MELFTVNRYIETGTTETAPQDGNEILSNLLEKVKNKRKKAKKVEIIEEESDTEHTAVDSTSTTNELKTDATPKSKKRKLNAAENETAAENIHKKVEDADEGVNYEILGEDVAITNKQKPQAADVVLPAWLAHPTIISTRLTNDEKETKSELNVSYPYLATHIVQSLKELKVTHLFPVQSEVIPWILEAHTKPPPFRPRDICVSAPTGSGKTLAFAIPIVQLLSANRVERKVRALVVLPVAELATQIFRVFKKLCEKTDLNVLHFTNRTTFAVEQENLVEYYKGAYYSKADIVITTPGRLVDHLHATKGFCLKSLEFLVIDEADRIMDAVFQNWFYHLDSHVRSASEQLLSGRAAPLCLNELLLSAGKQPHKLLFSATLSQDPEKLQNMRLFQPKLFTSVISDVKLLREHFTNVVMAAATAATAEAKNEATTTNDVNGEKRSGEFIGKYTTPAELTEKYCLTESSLKPLTLATLIQEQGWQKFLCFTNSTEAANRLTILLQKLLHDIPFFELSSSMHRNQREKCLNAFRGKRIAGLISTDAMARGIDVEVDIVISYDPPRHIKTYIHRIGRTARAGRAGTAVTLLTQPEHKHFNHILSQVGKSVNEELTVSTATEEKRAKEYADALAKLRKQLESDKRMKILAKRRAKMATIHPTDPETMTLMQKLQLAVDDAVVRKTNAAEGKKRKRLEKQARKAKADVYVAAAATALLLRQRLR